jgi:hypothetical protein
MLFETNAVRVSKCQCPQCGKQLDAASSVDGVTAIPKKGDISLCFYCGEILEYDENCVLTYITQEVIDELKKDNTYEEIVDIQRRIRLKGNTPTLH